MSSKIRAERNRTMVLTDSDKKIYGKNLLTINSSVAVEKILGKTINQDLFEILDYLPENFIDLLIIDPPYNLDKSFNSNKFKQKSNQEYLDWLDSFVSKLVKCLTPTASIYFCCDWKSSNAVYSVLDKYFIIRNRITWEREKGRGAKTNWKNNSEDIWFATVGKDYKYNLDQVMMKRKVLAPYRDSKGEAKDWTMNENGKFRLTHPSNLWTDISIPFWSMPENTDHPTQKPEKLIAKIILASSEKGDVIFDPFVGSGTTSVVAKKLDRNFVGVELDETFACLAEKRLFLADEDKSVQGYFEGVFWERNSYSLQKNKSS